MLKPLSLEELLQKHEEKKKEEERPKFVSKEERQRLALEKRKVEAEKMRQAYDETRKRRDEFLKKGENEFLNRTSSGRNNKEEKKDENVYILEYKSENKYRRIKLEN